jgi:hypothetical protein
MGEGCLVLLWGSWLSGSKSYLVEIRRYGWLEHTSVSMLMKIRTSFA